MSKHKAIVRGDVPKQRIRDGTRLMHTHETMVDFISGRPHANSYMDFFTSSVMGLHFLRNLEEELIYSDDDYYDDDDDDEEDDDDDDDDDVDDHHDPFGPRRNVLSHLEPHPRIRQLTDEEADKHAKELIEEEEKRKERTERNKRKKMRKKEKKRLEKENAVKNILLEEEAKKSDSSENPVIENNTEANESPESAETQNVTEAAGRDDDHNNKEENLLNVIKKDNKELKDPRQELDLNNSYVSTAESVPEETCKLQPSKGRKKGKTNLQEVQLSEEKKPEPVEKSPEVQKKEEKQEPTEEKAVDPTVEQLAKRSRELAGIGNRLAASKQYKAAVKYFTDAIKFNPKEFKLFGNRSFCYERMQQFEKALNDADVALSMQPKWIKGLFRKGKALSGLKRYYDASLIYKEVLTLESSSTEAMQELKRAQTLHLMEMGFTWAQSSKALKTHATLEEAIEALFSDDSNPAPGDAGSSRDTVDPPVVQEVYNVDEDEGEWIVLQASRPRTQQIRETDASSLSRSKSQSPTPGSRNAVKPPLFSVWVGSLASSITYPTLHDLFSRAGTVYSIKMLLEQQCAFVNYTRKEDCDRAILAFNGMVVEGSPLAVRYPSKIHTGPSLFKKECFFWRTTGCTRSDCTYKHVPENKNIDKDKFTSRLGNFHM